MTNYTVYNMHYTVKELRDKLNKLCAEGMGHCLVLVPNPDEEYYGNADYVTVNQVLADDNAKRCIYLETPNAEEEKEFWENEF